MISFSILAPLLFLSFCVGILLIGTLLYLYIYFSTPKYIYLSIVLVGMIGIFYVGNEIAVTTLSLLNLGKIGMQFHRIQALSIVYFLFALPYLLHHTLELNPALRNINRVIYLTGMVLAAAVTAIAFIHPDFFLALSKKSTDLLQPWNSGRATPGILYRMRDIIISLLAFYSLTLMIYDMAVHKNSRHTYLSLIGIIVAIFSGLLDFIFAAKESPTGSYSIRVFSWFCFGMTFFIVFSMITVMNFFAAQAKDMEKARRNEFLELLAGGIAHDFNNILTGILGNTTLALADLSKKDPNHELLTEIEKAAIRAKHLSQQLLTFSRGGLLLKNITSIPTLIHETVDFSLRGSNLRVHYGFADNLWNADIDANQISQVIQNLVINAKQAMPSGGTIDIILENTVILKTEMPLEPGKYLKLTIHDYGEGIPEKNLKEIFQPYFSTKKYGSGLGLAVSYSIIQKHNGLIEASSRSGEGSIFTVYLPATEEELTSVQNTNNAVKQTGGKALLMDDEEMILTIGSKLLKQIGFDTVCVHNGEEAVSVFNKAREEKKTFDFIIMDLTIVGGMGGKDAAEIIKKIEPSVKIIVSSGYSQDLILSDYRKFGFDGAIAKPYTLNELKTAVESLLNS